MDKQGRDWISTDGANPESDTEAMEPFEPVRDSAESGELSRKGDADNEDVATLRPRQHHNTASLALDESRPTKSGK
ncbi:hypothetical protein FRC10_006599 [Ceratobasidium sp. 414]|nr:hypothetical protein FRC10_006599 [Ceratobasidium sp. 414]